MLDEELAECDMRTNIADRIGPKVLEGMGGFIMREEASPEILA